MKRSIKILVYFLITIFLLLSLLQFRTVENLPENIATDLKTNKDYIELQLTPEIQLLHTIDSLQLLSSILLILAFLYVYRINKKHILNSIEDELEVESDAITINKDENIKGFNYAEFDKILENYAEKSNFLEESLQNVCNLLEISTAVVFKIQENKLKIVFEYALNYELNHHKFNINETIYQIILENKIPLYFNSISEDSIIVSSSLGNAPAKSLIVLPIFENNNIVGFLEAASFKELQIEEKQILEEYSSFIKI